VLATAVPVPFASKGRKINPELPPVSHIPPELLITAPRMLFPENDVVRVRVFTT